MKFSIIVPVYNAADCLAACLDSVVNQTEQSWECICVDDGSTDSAGAICDEYANKDSRFVVLHQSNKGLTATRNVGLQMAKGDYVCFLDCDDARRTDWLETAGSLLDGYGVDMVRLSYSCWHGEPYAAKLAEYDTGVKVFKGEDDVFRWGWEVLNKTAYVWLLVIRRASIEGFRFAEERIYREDMISSMHILKRITSVAQVDYPACLYRIRAGSMMHSKVTVGELIGYWNEYAKLLRDRNEQIVRLGMRESAINVFTLALFGSLRNWIYWCDPCERKYNEQIGQALDTSRKEGMVNFGAISGIWNLLFKSYCTIRIGWPLYAFTRFAALAVGVRRKLIGH